VTSRTFGPSFVLDKQETKTCTIKTIPSPHFFSLTGLMASRLLSTAVKSRVGITKQVLYRFFIFLNDVYKLYLVASMVQCFSTILQTMRLEYRVDALWHHHGLHQPWRLWERHYITTMMLKLLLAFLGVAISHCLNIVFGSFTDILPYLFSCLVCSPSCYFRKLACHPHHNTL
jgi:hypothetical protein